MIFQFLSDLNPTNTKRNKKTVEWIKNAGQQIQFLPPQLIYQNHQYINKYIEYFHNHLWSYIPSTIINLYLLNHHRKWYSQASHLFHYEAFMLLWSSTELLIYVDVWYIRIQALQQGDDRNYNSITPTDYKLNLNTVISINFEHKSWYK